LCRLFATAELLVKGKLKHLQSLSVERQMYYNNNSAQHSLLTDEIIETE